MCWVTNARVWLSGHGASGWFWLNPLRNETCGLLIWYRFSQVSGGWGALLHIFFEGRSEPWAKLTLPETIKTFPGGSSPSTAVCRGETWCFPLEGVWFLSGNGGSSWVQGSVSASCAWSMRIRRHEYTSGHCYIKEIPAIWNIRIRWVY